MSQAFDYVIVGGGSAGCVLANKLSEDPSFNVLLIEAGPPDTNPLIHMPRGIGKLYTSPQHTYYYEAQRTQEGRRLIEPWLSGRMIGGSSSLNGLMYLRGHQEDFNNWERNLGLSGWGWGAYGRIFRAMEDHELGANEYRGAGGPVAVSITKNRTLIMDKMIEAGCKLGLRHFEDSSMPEQEGIGYVNATIRKGRRWSAAKAFLAPARGRSNLQIVTDTEVQRVLFEGRRAVAVECVQTGRVVQYRAEREIILATGAMHSPQLLQLSGIGPTEHLQSFGIPIVQNSPNVGANLREHRVFRIQYRLSGDYSQNKDHSGWRIVLHGLRYALTHTGLLACPPYDVVAFVRTRENLTRPDAQIFIGAMSMDMSTAAEGFTVDIQLEKEPGVSIIGYNLRPESQGSVMIKSADPKTAPQVVTNYLSHEYDREVAVSTVRYMRRLFDQPMVRPYIQKEMLPGSNVQSDDEILRAYESVSGPGYHPVGTCRMGTDADSVVDPRLCVRGVSGLRIGDVSVFPTLISANTNAAAMATAWRASELILEDARKPTAPLTA